MGERSGVERCGDEQRGCQCPYGGRGGCREPAHGRGQGRRRRPDRVGGDAGRDHPFDCRHRQRGVALCRGRHGARPADDRHPLGYGQARYFWSLLAAVGIFVIGGLLAIADGVQSLRQPEPLTNVPVGVAVLVVSAGLEGLSWRTAHRQLRAEANARHLDLGEYMAVSSDPTPTTVFLEDSAALVGLTLALMALVLHLVTGSAVWDGAASLLIGLLLIVVAFVLMRRSGALLIDEAAPADIRERLREGVAAEPWVAEVAELTAVYVGPRQLLVLAHVVPVADADLVGGVGGLRRRLLSLPAVAAVEITPVERPS